MSAPLPNERRPSESPEAYTAFSEFLNAGPERSLTSVADKLGKSHSLMRKWSARHEWSARARDHDNSRKRVVTLSENAEAGKIVAKWIRRRSQMSEEAYAMAKRLRRQALLMLEVELDSSTWSKGTATTMAKAALEMAYSAVDREIAAYDDIDASFDPLTATPEDCRAFAQRLIERERTKRDALHAMQSRASS